MYANELERQTRESSAARYKDTSLDPSQTVDVLKEMGIKKNGYNYYNSFNVYKNFEGTDFLEGGIAYFFFTKPQLNLSQNDDDIKRHYPHFYSYLGKDRSSGAGKAYADMLYGSGFVYPLTNLGISFDSQDSILETDEYNETFRGYKLVAPTTAVKTRTSGDFSITYMETSDMYVTNYHKLWMDYIEAVRSGIMLPRKSSIKGVQGSSTSVSMTGDIDYMNSLYYFVLEADGQTIKYYAKYTGIFPTNNPYSVYKWELGGHEIFKPTVNYTYNFKEELNPVILNEFNLVSGYNNSGTLAATGDGKNGFHMKQVRVRKVNREGERFILEFLNKKGDTI